MLSSRLSCFPHSALQTLEPERCLWGGGEWERNAVRWKKRRESESEGLLFVRIMPLRCFPRSRRELPGPPPCLKAFFLSSSHPSLSPKESILCPLPSSPQNNGPLLWKKKKKLHSSAPISTCLSLMDPFPFEPVKYTSSLICCLFHIPSACRVGCMDGGNTRDWFCLQFDNLTAAAYTRMTMSEMQLSECLSLKQREDTWPYEPPWTGVVVVYSCDHAWCLFHFKRVSDDDCLRLHSDLSLQLRMTWYSSSYIKSFLLISAAPCGQKVIWHLFLWRPWFDLCKRNQKKQHTIFQILFYFFFKHCCFHGARLTG